MSRSGANLEWKRVFFESRINYRRKCQQEGEHDPSLMALHDEAIQSYEKELGEVYRAIKST